MTWQPLNLASPQYAVPPNPPAVELHGLLYRGKRHVVSGASESAKTLIVWALALDGLRAGLRVACIDFEMGPSATRRLLVDLGATDDELAAIDYYEPTTPPTKHDLDNLAESADLVIIDAAAGAYDLSNLDDNKRQDAERFARTWIAPLWQRNVATALVDHVTKNAETRGRYAIGSERKLGGCDVHLGTEVVGTPLTRGGSGLVKIHVHKDRPGFLRRPTAAEIVLTSDPDTHAITWTLQEPAASGTWQPTVFMERISTYLQAQPEPVSKNNVEQAIRGQASYKRQAIDALITDGYINQIDGPNRAKLLVSVRPYYTGSSEFVGSSSETNPLGSSVRPPFTGDEDETSDDELERLRFVGEEMGLTS